MIEISSDHPASSRGETTPTLFRRFARVVERDPDLVALDIAGQGYSYGDLARLVTAVAEQIRDVQGAPGRIALCAHRSAALFGGHLAIQSLGGSAVPIDPGNPVERCAEVLFQSGARVALVDTAGAALLSSVPEAERPDLVLLPEVSPGSGPISLPGEPGGAEDEIYVLFTSGSTGRPKGVPIRQRHFSLFVDFMIERYDLRPGRRFGQTFSQVFDPFMGGMFAAFCAGATLVDISPAAARNPAVTIPERRLSHWFSVPSSVSLAHAAANLPAGRAPDLEFGMFIGEPLTQQQATLWNAMAPNAKIVNVYGPTELTVACAEQVLQPDPATWPGSSNGTVPIGRIYPHLEYVAIGADGQAAEQGELCVRGPQRFDGYLSDKDNRNRFYAFEPGRRAVDVTDRVPRSDHWYRTGDLVRHEPGGLVHCGRIDNQIKLLGHRIELEEIEAVLRRHPQVMEAVVVGSLSAPDTLHAAYSGHSVPPEELAEWLGAVLPGYMVPGTYRHYGELPVSLVGKIDRKAIKADS